MRDYEVTLIEKVSYKIVVTADSTETARDRAWDALEEDKSQFDKEGEWTNYAFIEEV